jgi:outer membrane lipoprotein-sorting protein
MGPSALDALTRIVAVALIVSGANLFALATIAAPAFAQTKTVPADPTTTPAVLPPAWVAFERAWAGVAAYRATVTVFDQKGTQAQNVVFDYSFRKPSSATVHVVKGPNAGGTLVWSGGKTVVAHRGSGLLRLFTKTYALHDPAVTTLRGSSIDQLSFGAIISHGLDTAGSVSEAAGPVIDGVSTETVTLVPTSSVTDAGLTLEIVDISSATNLPIRVLGYDGPTLVRQVQFSNVKLQS